MIYPTIQKPEPAIEIKSVHVGAANAWRISRSSSGVMRSSASMISTHSYCQRTFPTPNFLARQFSVPSKLYNPSPSCLGDRLSSVCAPESTTTISCANQTLARTVSRFAASFLTGDKHGQRRPSRRTARSLRCSSRFLLSRAGFPTTNASRFILHPARAPTIAPSPTVTPGPTNASHKSTRRSQSYRGRAARKIRLGMIVCSRARCARCEP